MDMNELRERCELATIRFDMLVPVALALVDAESPPDWFEDEFVFNFPESPDHELFNNLPFLKPFADEEDEIDVMELAWALAERNLPGFLAKVSHPCMTFGKGGSRSYSWGCTYFTWVYADTLEGVVEEALKWADACDVKDGKPAEAAA